MSTINEYKKSGSGKVFFGMLLLVLGSLMLLNRINLGFNLPIFPILLIAVGLRWGLNDKFRSPKSFVALTIGSILLLNDLTPYDFDDFIWPLLLIGIGVYVIMGRGKDRARTNVADLEWDKRQPVDGQPAPPLSYEPSSDPLNSATEQDFIDSTSIFGGVKKNVVSKNFRGGDVVNFMGGCEINLSQADFTGKAILDVTQFFGGTKIVVPPHWEIIPEMTAFFGSVEDKRPIHPQVSSGKVLVIRGTSVFGGIDIKSY